MNEFYIDKQKFSYSHEKDSCNEIHIKSYPKSYLIEFVEKKQRGEDFFSLNKETEYPLVVIDENVNEKYFGMSLLEGKVYIVNAMEKNKEIHGV